VLLQADNLQFRYARRAAGTGWPRGAPIAPDFVLDDVSVRVPRGSLVGILGPNGSGKTTLLNLLSGALQPIAGRVAIDERPLASIPRRELARRIAVVPQNTHLAFDYTALEIVLMGRYPWMRAFEVEGPDDLASALDALEATGTRHLAARAYPTLSGGEQQRVIIASVLAQLDARPRAGVEACPVSSLLFLDEPTASLDLKYQIEIAALVRRLHDTRDITVLLSTHDLRLVATLCTWTILIAGGRVIAEGPPTETMTPPLIGALYDVDPAIVGPLVAR
jgi:iron complex transport system ATP-binding protein